MHAELAAVPDSLYQVTRANRVIAVVMPRNESTRQFDIASVSWVHCPI